MENQVYKVTTIESCKDYKELIFILTKDEKNNIVKEYHFENICPISIEQDEVLIYPTQTFTDKQIQMMRMCAIATIEQLKNSGTYVVKTALKPKLIQEQNKIEDEDIQVLEIICGKSDYIEYAKSVGKNTDVVMIDSKNNKIEKSMSIAGAMQLLKIENILPKNIEIFYKKELNRIEELKSHIQKAEFLYVWDIRQAKKYGFTNEEIADLSGESVKEIEAICIGNNF